MHRFCNYLLLEIVQGERMEETKTIVEDACKDDGESQLVNTLTASFTRFHAHPDIKEAAAETLTILGFNPGERGGANSQTRRGVAIGAL